MRAVPDRETKFAPVAQLDPGLARPVRQATKPRTRAFGVRTEGDDVAFGDRERARLVTERDVGAGRCEANPFQLAALEAEYVVVGEADHPAALIRRRYRAEPRAKSADLWAVRHDVVELDLDRVPGGKAEPSARHTMNARACDTLRSLDHSRGVPG